MREFLLAIIVLCVVLLTAGHAISGPYQPLSFLVYTYDSASIAVTGSYDSGVGYTSNAVNGLGVVVTDASGEIVGSIDFPGVTQFNAAYFVSQYGLVINQTVITPEEIKAYFPASAGVFGAFNTAEWVTAIVFIFSGLVALGLFFVGSRIAKKVMGGV